MNDLEERLRAALDARAQTYETSPTAWLRVQERRRGPLRRWEVVLVALPVALVALLVPVLFGGFQGGQVMTGPPPKPTPVGQALVIDNPAENRPMRLWLARDHEGALVFCRAVQYAGGASSDGCGSTFVNRESEAAWLEGSTESVPPREKVLAYGAARANVAKVTAVTKDGKRLDGALYRPSGAPLQIWTVAYPSTERIGRYEFAAADGAVLAREEPRAMLPASDQGEPAGPAVEMKGMSVRPYLTPDRTLIWTRGGREVGLNFVRAKDLMTDMGGRRYPVELRVNGDRWFGIAREGTAKVTLTRKGGASLEATVRTDPWKVGVSLFAGELPSSGDPYLEGFELVGHDASGKVLWREDHPADRPKWDPNPPIGEVVTLGEAKVWFSKVTLADGRTWDGLCRSVAGTKTSCEAFQPVAAGDGRRLPDLGNSAIGVAGSAVTQVEAVKSGTRGSVYAPVGAPLKIWVVPNSGGSERFVLQDAEQDTVATVGGSAPDTCSVSPPVGPAAALGTGATLTHQDGCLIIWTDDGRFITKKHEIDDATYTFGSGVLAGYAVTKTAKVELVFDDGSRVAATMSADPWGLGLTLFSARSTKPSVDASVVGYDAAGKEIWRR
ncbi:hypothetical protein [Nonomuraea dietziae]|uniref:hypothetical protein n=1 Tax=Nonomuraea dietziae TaxID=65515 RepID=UPI0034166616